MNDSFFNRPQGNPAAVARGNNPGQGQAGNVNPQQEQARRQQEQARQQQEQARRRFGKIPTNPVPFPGQMNGNMQQVQTGRRPPNPGEQVNTQAPIPAGQMAAATSQGAVPAQTPQAQPMLMPQAGGGNPQMASPGGFGQLSPQAQQAALQRQLQQQHMAGR